MRIVAVDPLQHVETTPRLYLWLVDTQPPTTTAALASARYSNADAANVTVSCSGEAFPCTYCWRVAVVDSGYSDNGCSLPGVAALTVPAGPDGTTTVIVTAVDDAGNVGNAVVLSWVQDTTPPVTLTAIVSSTTVWVPAIHTFAVNTSTVDVSVSASEAVAVYRVTVTWADGSGDALASEVASPVNGVVHVPLAVQGFVTVTLTAVDLAGNVEAVGRSVAVVVVSQPPLTIVTGPAVAVTNVSGVTFTASCPGADARVLQGFDVSWSPPLPHGAVVNVSGA